MSRRLTYRICLLLALLVLLLFAFFTVVFIKHDRLLPFHGTKLIRLSPGESLHSLSRVLYEKGAISSPQIFYYQAKLFSSPSKFEAGEYRLVGSMPVTVLFDHLLKGRVQAHRFAIIEGWTISQLIAAIRRTEPLGSAHFNLTDLKQAFPNDADLEGRFFPATYQYRWGQKPLNFLKKSHRKMQLVLERIWKGRKKGLPYSHKNEMLVAASLIEKETAMSHERPLISQVIINRLAKNMKLQIDATVLYSMKGNRPKNGRVLHRMLTTNSLYNTYKHKGLPPGPICIPSLASLKAAVHPKQTKALYYVVSGRDGSHHFSETYESHQRAVQDYREKRKAGLLSLFQFIDEVTHQDGILTLGILKPLLPFLLSGVTLSYSFFA